MKALEMCENTAFLLNVVVPSNESSHHVLSLLQYLSPKIQQNYF